MVAVSLSGFTEDVCVIESPFSDEALRVNGQPSAWAKLEDIFVVHVSMQHHNVALRRQQVRRSFGRNAKDSAVDF
jgi:hypothetical protein